MKKKPDPSNILAKLENKFFYNGDSTQDYEEMDKKVVTAIFNALKKDKRLCLELFKRYFNLKRYQDSTFIHLRHSYEHSLAELNKKLSLEILKRVENENKTSGL